MFAAAWCHMQHSKRSSLAERVPKTTGTCILFQSTCDFRGCTGTDTHFHISVPLLKKIVMLPSKQPLWNINRLKLTDFCICATVASLVQHQIQASKPIRAPWYRQVKLKSILLMKYLHLSMVFQNDFSQLRFQKHSGPCLGGVVQLSSL